MLVISLYLSQGMHRQRHDSRGRISRATSLCSIARMAGARHVLRGAQSVSGCWKMHWKECVQLFRPPRNRAQWLRYQHVQPLESLEFERSMRPRVFAEASGMHPACSRPWCRSYWSGTPLMLHQRMPNLRLLLGHCPGTSVDAGKPGLAFDFRPLAFLCESSSMIATRKTISTTC